MVEDNIKKLTDEEAACTFKQMSDDFLKELKNNPALNELCARQYGDIPFINRVIKELNPKHALELYHTVNSVNEPLCKGMMNLLGTVLEIMRD